MVVFRRVTQNSASWNFFEFKQLTACGFKTPPVAISFRVSAKRGKFPQKATADQLPAGI